MICPMKGIFGFRSGGSWGATCALNILRTRRKNAASRARPTWGIRKAMFLRIVWGAGQREVHVFVISENVLYFLSGLGTKGLSISCDSDSNRHPALNYLRKATTSGPQVVKDVPFFEMMERSR
jgi:hypothetical protein